LPYESGGCQGASKFFESATERAWFRLADRFGETNVAAFRQRLEAEGTASQWLAFQQIEPKAAERMDWLLKVIICELVAIRVTNGAEKAAEFEGRVIEWGKN